MTEDEQIQEIAQWFVYRGHQLVVHEIGGEWRAPYTPLGQRFGVGAFGSGKTALEAAQAAQEQFDREHPPKNVRATRSFFVEVSDTLSSMTDEVTVQKFSADANGPTTEVETVEAEPTIEEEIINSRPDLVKTAEQHRLGVVLEREPDGTFTGVLLDDEGRYLKQAHGSDYHDAVLELFTDTYFPSDEVRREQN